MRFSWWWLIAIGRWQVPDLLITNDFESVQIVQISRDIILRVVALIGQTAEQIDFIADFGETVAQTWTRRWPVFGRLRR